MRHGVKKIKFKRGKDAKKMLVKKLAVNFIKQGHLVTTIKKAKVLKSTIERAVEHSKTFTQANQNFLLSMLGDWKMVQMMFKGVGPGLKDKIGGYVRLVKLGVRQSDGSDIAEVRWVYPVVLSEKKEAVAKKEKTAEKKQISKSKKT